MPRPTSLSLSLALSLSPTAYLPEAVQRMEEYQRSKSCANAKATRAQRPQTLNNGIQIPVFVKGGNAGSTHKHSKCKREKGGRGKKNGNKKQCTSLVSRREIKWEGFRSGHGSGQKGRAASEREMK
jgi:hypothetical protein